MNPIPAPLRRVAEILMALCLGVMALSVFINVVLRYGFGSGIAATEEISRLLFVWLVFIGATAAYPAGEHMAFTSLIVPLKNRPIAFMAVTILVRLLVIMSCGFVAWGAWQQVIVGMGSHSTVLHYPIALLPLPALICSASITLMALIELLRFKPLNLGYGVEVE